VPDGTVADAGAQFLNVTPLLPKEITDLFPNGLPAILISPQYRARPDNRTFEAFFGIPEEGAVFTGTFGGEYEIGSVSEPHLIEGRDETDCRPLAANTAPGQVLSELLDWDVVTWVSDRHPSVGGLFVDTLINTGCGSVNTTKGGWSLVSYGLEVMPNLGAEKPANLDSVEMPNEVTTAANPAVFVRLLQQLYGELDDVLQHKACGIDDTGGTPWPLAETSCANLESSLAFAKGKLDRCIDAAFQPKQSSGDQNCQSFNSQFANFELTLSQTTSQCLGDPASCDPANRLGELTMRARVIRHVFEFRFLPSIPSDGF
jgi:hypothetical protein